MTSHAKIDFPALIEPVARIVWGTPNKQLSRPSDIRWGNSGSRSVDPKKVSGTITRVAKVAVAWT
jgi:hypothetical protein